MAWFLGVLGVYMLIGVGIFAEAVRRVKAIESLDDVELAKVRRKSELAAAIKRLDCFGVLNGAFCMAIAWPAMLPLAFRDIMQQLRNSRKRGIGKPLEKCDSDDSCAEAK